MKQPDDVEKRINLFKDYYQSVISMSKSNNNDELQNASGNGTDFSQKTLEHYNLMFRHIYKDTQGLFANYLLSEPVNKSNNEHDSAPVLLLSHSNYSQKQAIETAIRDRASIIEGPPGTGKTTTILSIIANLVIRGKRVAVISKNNSAIDNVKDELDKLNLPPFYLRLGNKETIMEPLAQTIKILIGETMEQVKLLSEPSENDNSLSSLYWELKEIEADINNLIRLKNQRQEDENQLRHLKKRDEAFHESVEFRNLQRFSRKSLTVLRQEIDRIASALQRLDAQSSISFLDRLINRLRWRLTTKQFQTNGLLLQFRLEHIYLVREIEELSSQLTTSELQDKQDRLKHLYDEQYITSSLSALQDFLYEYCNRNDYQEAVNAVLNYKGNNELYNCKTNLREIYPVILTTADALVYNFKDLLQSGEKIDYIIMDEASQCDLIAGLPMLSLADRCVVVGDQKQLSAIIKDPLDNNSVIDEHHDYYKQTFLSSVQNVWGIKPILLQEHYRCDYSIINYCNKFFYNSELIIYTEANASAMQLLIVDQGKYADTVGSSFKNEREIKSIEGIAGTGLQASYVITPFKGQGEMLRSYFSCEKDICGTIHTFQGRGEDIVYFSTVLNNLPFANRHIKGNHCMFTKELVNVAVSRAKKRFVLVSDRDYLHSSNQEMKNLIDYIETYGEKIPDKTVCIFDGLYRLMKSYTRMASIDNVFEQKIFYLLQEYCDNYPAFHFFVKLPLADLITDKAYLNSNPEIKRFALHWNTHVDFTIFNAINNPVLVFELDGKHHKKDDQRERDAKKDAALRHMGIPLWRLPSKAALSKDDFSKNIEILLSKQLP